MRGKVNRRTFLGFLGALIASPISSFSNSFAKRTETQKSLYEKFSMISLGKIKTGKYKNVSFDHPEIFMQEIKKNIEKGKATQFEKDFYNNISDLKVLNIDNIEKCRILQTIFNDRSYYSYIKDKEDICQTPMETLKRGGGDCEDFAALKYMALLILGLPNNSLYIVEGNLNGIEGHAVLVVVIRNIKIVLENFGNYSKGYEITTTQKHSYGGNFVPIFCYDFKHRKQFFFQKLKS